MYIMITKYTVPLNFIESQNNLDQKKKGGGRRRGADKTQNPLS